MSLLHENQACIPDPDAYDHVDDFVDGVPDSTDLDDEEEDTECERGGCMPDPEDFD